MKINKTKIPALLLAVITLCLIASFPYFLEAKPRDKDLAMRDYMVEMSRHLGVTCTYCHDLKNFKSDKMETFKISNAHIAVVKDLNKKHLGNLGIKKVDCFMCHRGKAIPDYKD